MDLDSAQQELLAVEATAMLTRLQSISERQRELLAQLSSPAAAPSGVHPSPCLVRTAICTAVPVGPATPHPKSNLSLTLNLSRRGKA